MKYFLNFWEEQLKKHVVSGVFLSGEGFYVDGWQKTLSVLCRNRRVFKGSNLIVKGAAYGAREFFYVRVLDKYLISCKGRTRVKIVMAVINIRNMIVTLPFQTLESIGTRQNQRLSV